MGELERKAQLANMTGSLRCRCPGFQEMTRVECKSFDGVQYCYFACVDPKDSNLETRYPVGEGNLCRCPLGSKLDKASIRIQEDAEATWGFAKCTPLAKGVEIPEEDAADNASSLPMWPVAFAIGGLLWFTTRR